MGSGGERPTPDGAKGLKNFLTIVNEKLQFLNTALLFLLIFNENFAKSPNKFENFLEI